MNRHGQKGSVLIYILVSILLAGLLVVSLTSGPQKSATTEQLDELTGSIYADLKAITAAITDCALQYPAQIDRNGDGNICRDSAVTVPATACNSIAVLDNPNPPFPVYNQVLGAAADATAYGAAGTVIRNIACPGAPGVAGATGLPLVFGATGQGLNRSIAGLRQLDIFNTGAPTYTVTYFNDGATSTTGEGVYLRITRAAASPLWTEAMARLNTKYSACQAAAVTAAGACVNGCFYLWLTRRPSTAIATSDDGVDCTIAANL